MWFSFMKERDYGAHYKINNDKVIKANETCCGRILWHCFRNYFIFGFVAWGKVKTKNKYHPHNGYKVL